MITKNDCLSMLVKLEDSGINIDQYMKQLLISKEIPIDVLKFIYNNQGLDIINFYELLRKNHNSKKSPLYINIIKEDTKQNIIITLSCLLTQIVLYSNKLTDATKFLKEARAEEISRVLNDYFNNSDISGCLAVLKLIRTDLLVLEYISGRRDMQ